MNSFLNKIYQWQESISENKFEKIKRIFLLTGWSLIIIPLFIIGIFYISKTSIQCDICGVAGIIMVIEGMLILFVTVMNLDNSRFIFSTVLWFLGINVLFILIFSGLLDRIPVRIR
ncbi:MAG TPA: hypothetical protein DHV28_08465 [Ignavibacteriales bacterium]|nr:hypothetical protein [Ignavibacteriales bacterium]